MADRVQRATTMADPVQGASTMADPVQGASTMADPGQRDTTMADPVQRASTMADPVQGASTMADPVQGASTMADPTQAPVGQQSLVVKIVQMLKNLSTTIWNLLYGYPYVLILQSLAALILALYSASTTRNQSKLFSMVTGIMFLASGIYVFLLGIAFWRKNEIRNWCSTVAADYWWGLLGLRIVVAIGLLRLFVYVSALLEEQKDLDGYSTAFFLSSYLHVVSILKLFNIEDYVCLSDGLLAIAVMVSARLDHVHAVEEMCHVEAIVNGTVVLMNGSIVSVNGTDIAINILSSAGFFNHISRTVCSYVAAGALFCFRITEIPYGREQLAPQGQAQGDIELVVV